MNLKICDVSFEFLFLILTWKDRKVEAKFPHSVLQEGGQGLLCATEALGIFLLV